MLAGLFECAFLAEGSARFAYIPAVEDEPVVCNGAKVAGYVAFEVFLDGQRGASIT